jgi:DNA-binding response OmpR family regulator
LQNPYPEFWNPHSEIIRVLLIEDNPGDTRLVREMLAEARGALFDLECADRPSAGLKRLAEGDIDVVLLDLGLPNSQGLDTCTKVYAQAPEVPIVVLTGLDDEVMGLQAIEIGAQDYLVKGQVDSNPLARALRYAIERKRAEETLRASARQWQTTFDAISDAVSLMDLEWRILRCNVAMAKFLGKPFSDIIGRPCWELVHGTSEPIEGCPFVRMRETYRKATLVLQIDDRWLRVRFKSYVNMHFHKRFDNLAISLMLFLLPTNVERSEIAQCPASRMIVMLPMSSGYCWNPSSLQKSMGDATAQWTYGRL